MAKTLSIGIKKESRIVIYGLRFFIYLTVIVGGIFMLLPFWWMIITAFKLPAEVFSIPIKWIPSRFTLVNFYELFRTFSYFRYLWNTFAITVVDTGSSVFLAAMAGYGFAKFRVKGASIIFLVILSGVMLPFSVRLIPMYLMMSKMGLNNTYLGVIAPNLLSIFGIFLLRQSMLSIPDELIDAARIEGASEWRIFLAIMLPLSKATLIALAIIKSLWVWNDFLWPLVMLTGKSKLTLSLGLQMLMGYYETAYGALMAGSLLVMLPTLILYAFLQRQIIAGVTMTGLKG